MHRLLSLALLTPLALGCAPTGASLPGADVVSDRVQRSVDLGRVSRDAQLDFVIGLRLRDREQLHKLVDARRPGDEGLAPGDFADRFAPSVLAYSRMVAWLQSNQILVTRTVVGRTTISARGSAAAIERAFGVELHEYSDGGDTFRAAATALHLPYDALDITVGVAGLSGSQTWRSHLVAPNLNATTPLRPNELQALYGATGIANPGMGETVAILGAGFAPDPAKDVDAYMTAFSPFGKTSAPGYTQVLLGGANRDPVGTANGEYVENCLDAEMVLAMAPLAKVVHVIAATNTPGLFPDGISYIVNSVPEAHAVSVSYGSCERGVSQEAPVLNTLFEQALAQGQTWFFASGDTGTDGCRDGSGNQHISAGWPASSPYVIGVGGTMIGSAGTEVTWNENDPTNGAAAGGGAPSEMFAKPAYQVGLTPNDAARDEPDVAAIAGGGGVWVSYRGQRNAVGGTSAAAPIWAGVWALVDQGKGGTGIPDALTKIYAVGKTAAFNDITKGDNGGPDGISPGYPATTFYDLATGWGSPNVAQLITRLP
ncbi:MAG: hypothetical protein JWN44_6198 [Myxococcales bacterium]|nr:hypothetical protein [Myxococcales bacterium]